VIRYARAGALVSAAHATHQAVGRDDAKGNDGDEQHSERKRHRPYGFDRRQHERDRQSYAAEQQRKTLPCGRAFASAHARMADGQAFDGVTRKRACEVAADRAAQCAGRNDGKIVRLQPRQHFAQSIRPESLRRDDEASRAHPLFEQTLGETLPWAERARRFHLAGFERSLEGNAAAFRKRTIVLLRADPTIGD
jgi:hypothetical protein